MEIDVPNFKRHKLAAPREGFIGHAQHGSFTVRAQALASAVYEIFDLLPTQRVSVVLTGRGLSPILLSPSRTVSLEQGFKDPPRYGRVRW